MAITQSAIRNNNGINFTYIVDSPADWSGVTNSTYFKDLSDGLIYFKNSLGNVLGMFYVFTGGTVTGLTINGNVGIGTTTPSEKLDVSGKTKTLNLQVTSGATTGYVLTSDVLGNATWQIPPVGIHAARIPASGGYINPLMVTYQATAVTTYAVNALRCFIFMPIKTFTIVSYSINVTTAVAASNMRVLFYDDLNGTPNAKLHESANVDTSTTGVKTVTQAYTFNAGTTYWLCVQTSAAISMTSHSFNGGFSWQQTAAPNNMVNNVQYTYALGSAPATLTTTGAGYATNNLPHLIFNL